ncbi:MAG: hypothetical protein KJN97_14630, partial [Deltaproteobacteria bacterium]|nr:hypothetical protein [Deltaproteobacteria bacterium]
KALGLIDEMAGLSEALHKARAAAGLGPEVPVELWPAPKGMLDAINELLSGNGEDDARTLQRLWLRQHPLATTLPLAAWAETLRVLAEEQVALIPPYLFTVR